MMARRHDINDIENEINSLPDNVQETIPEPEVYVPEARIPQQSSTRNVQNVNRQDNNEKAANVPNNTSNYSSNNNSNKSHLFIGLAAGVVLCVGLFFMFAGSGSKDKTTTNSKEQVTKIGSSGGAVLPKTNNTNPTVSTPSVQPSKSAPVNYSPIYMGAISGAYESSADKENNYVHSAKLTIDGNLRTCWSEGVPGIGIGENVVYQFNGTYKVRGINIWPGHHKSTELYYKNARPSMIKVEGVGYSQTWKMSDTMTKHTLQFNEPINTNYITITILDAYSGNTWQDTCITEVEFF